MNIYLVRHGETQSNNDKAYYGNLDCGLTHNGKLQALAVKDKLSSVKFDGVFSSHMKRARETAEIILEDRNCKIVEDKRAAEMNMGIFEGKKYEDLSKKYPEEWKAWCDNWKSYEIPEGESYVDFYNRVRDFFEDILKFQGENILVVTHGGVIKSICAYILGDNFDIFWKIGSKNGDITLIKYEYGNVYLDAIIPVEY